MKKKKLKKGTIVLGSIFLVIVILGAIVFFIVKSIPVAVIAVENIDLNQVGDGFYTGEYEDGPVLANVTVEMKDHQISDIVINEHRTGLGSKAEAITRDIIQVQNLDVDVISGATMSSYVILKAVEVALADK